ncbi:hypothetical protein DRE_05153 [Drechslerella stenobrocha 248]|uniref:Uncharacterized protein n=1 Tax=Drechslerella stenobrocha 248 TaxID=1043628 RepID=W7HNZ5_9PEZI|nr:hypothetical protein DRE_05153 [Drechslerella stenobrocha 248]
MLRSIAVRSARLRVVQPALSPLPRASALPRRLYASDAGAGASAGPARVLTGNPEIDDPGMNDGYSVTQPPPLKAQFRDPYETYWDQQERRNFGDPIHEDNDILGIFSPWEYTAATSKHAAISVACFIAVGLGVVGLIYKTYPDKPAVPREFPDNGLEKALGGKAALLARPEGSY